MEAQTKRPPPPYFAFKTLTNTIEKMEEHGPPNRVDRTFLTGMSGAAQTQFIAGLKSLGLISNDEKGIVQPALMELVNNPDDRPALIGKLLRERYPEAVSLGEGNATTGELVEIFKEYGVQGDTARKAIAFYLQAAKYAGDVPLSHHFKTPTGERAPEAAADAVGRPSRRRRSNPPSPTESLLVSIPPSLASWETSPSGGRRGRSRSTTTSRSPSTPS